MADHHTGTLTRDGVNDRVVALIAEIGHVPLEQITPTATLDNEIQLESVAFVELQVALEEQFQILIDPIHVVELNELGAIVDYIYQCTLEGQQ